MVTRRMAISERNTIPAKVRMLRACLARILFKSGVRLGRRRANAMVAIDSQYHEIIRVALSLWLLNIGEHTHSKGKHIRQCSS